jgi:glycerol uptake facilitator protein
MGDHHRMGVRVAAPGVVGEVLAEFAGTMILVLFGCGVVAQVVVAGVGEVASIHWAWGVGAAMGMYVAGRTSGAHLNPAVTVALAAFKGFPWRKVGPYAAAQLLGAFVAALVVRWNYSEALAAFDPGRTAKSQGVFSTRPASALGVGEWGAFRDQVIGTAILLFLILAVTDTLAAPAQVRLAPVVIGLLVVAIGMAWGGNAGYALNPARDFGPRLASFLTGYDGAFRDTTGYPYWWIPLVAPLAGGLVGAGLYQVLVGRYLPAADAGADRRSGGEALQDLEQGVAR